MEEEFLQHIQKNFPELLHTKSVIAISGGVDSVVLTHLCHKLKLDFSLAHCNFQLRDQESDADQNFVKGLAEKLKVKVFVRNFATRDFAQKNQLSTQMAARKLRYDWFQNLRDKHDFAQILTGHHLNDDLETFLINFTRGTGLPGLTGIPEKHNAVVRPMLNFERKAIEGFARAHDIKWREDSTNKSDDYFRNEIRHHIIPLLKKNNTSLLQSFQKTRRYLNQSQQLVDDYMKEIRQETVKKKGDTLEFTIEKIKNYPHPKAILYELFSPYGFTQWTDIYGLLFSQSGKEVRSSKYRLIRDRNRFLLIANKKTKRGFYRITEGQKRLKFEKGRLNFYCVTKIAQKDAKIAYIAHKKLRFPLRLRQWKSGDRFQPFGMRGTKNVSDFLIDKKLSIVEKENTWVLESDGKIVWIVGHRLDERFKVENKTQTIFKIKLSV